MSLLRPCLDCGQPSAKTRCPDCERPVERQRHDQRYDGKEWHQVRAQTLARHRRLHGNVCPGFGDHEPHPSSDLTVHHVVELSQGGSLLDRSNLAVVCRGWNSTMANRARSHSYAG